MCGRKVQGRSQADPLVMMSPARPQRCTLVASTLSSGRRLASKLRGGPMKNSFGLTMSLAVLTFCGTELSAQERQTSNPNRAVPDTITLIGCLDRADQFNAANPDTTVDSLSFVLTHASRDGKAASSKPTADARGSASEAGSIYRLDGAVATLNPHVGHKVQLSGAIEPSTSGTSGGTDPTSAANAPRLKVASIKMLAETCAR